ncbi:serpin family protein [Streptomyces sp. NBC_00094]|uniref:serpin family protein n=1 Tax=Streptomyces sp. NBC_00094 TaxID=2903620 RepID=UPI00224FF237|nr:serpin family protein [Streptomyces sp. NBC_00094]MCX5390420.1 serpin family protein [Streptomyces sp. NBC_00094]
MTHSPTVLRADAVRTLALRWLPHLGGGDFVVSPVGLWSALGAVASGARGRTGEELAGLLGVEGEAAAAGVTDVGRWLGGTGGVAMATGVWSTVPVRDGFRRGLPDVRFGVLPGAAYLALPDTVFGATDDVSWEEPPDAQEELDDWVRGATGGRIQRLPLDLDGSEDLVLLNALALKASWRTAFPGHLTRDEPFTDGSGVTRPVPTMRQRIPAGWVWYVGGVVVVELPCEGGARVRFALGAEGAGAGDVVPAAWAGGDERTPLVADSVDLALPRFTLRTRSDVRPALDALGVRLALRPEADFSGISEADLYIDKVLQEAVVEVAEEGVEAAAVTTVTMTRSAAAPRPTVVERIAFDRPFGVVVLDEAGEVPLFVGWRQDTP